MKYALLIHWNESSAKDAPEGHVTEILQACDDHNRVMQDAGEWIKGAPLQTTSEAVSVRVRDGRALLSDGPFAETKEQLGGFTILDCESLERAEVLAGEILEAQRNYEGRIDLYQIG